MSITPQSFRGHDVQDATYKSRLLQSRSLERVGRSVLVQPAGGYSRLVRSETTPRQLLLVVEVLAAGVTAAMEDLEEWFRPGTFGPLVVDFDGVSRAADVVVQVTRRYDGGPRIFSAELLALDPRWRSEDEQRDSQTLTGTPTRWTIANDGNAFEDRARLYVRPGALKGATVGQRYVTEVVVANRVARAFANYALEVTDGGWDHAAEVTASRSQADADDVRVYVDGVEQSRWLGEHVDNDANSTATKIWTNLDLSPAVTAELVDALTATSPLNGEELAVKVAPGLSGWAWTGAFLIGDEVFLYHGLGRRESDNAPVFLNVVRGARNTTAATHSAGDTCYRVERRVQIVYGDTGLAAPPSDAEHKPMLDLTTNTITNVRLEWINFRHATDPRSMQWAARTRTDDNRRTRILAPVASPAASLNFEYQADGAEVNKPENNALGFDFPSGTGASGGNVASLTRAVSGSLALLLKGTDTDGNEVDVVTYAGELTSAAANVTDPGEITRLEVYCRSQVVLDTPRSGTLATTDLTSSYGPVQQQVTVEGNGELRAVAVYLQAIAGLHDVRAQLWSDNGADAPSVAVSDEVTIGDPADGDTWNVAVFSVAVKVTDGQKYWVRLRNVNATTVRGIRYPSPYAGGVSSVAGYVFGARLLSSELDFEANSEATDADTASVDGLVVHLNSSGVPYIQQRGRQDLYDHRWALRCLGTGQEIEARYAALAEEVIEVDVEARAVRSLLECPYRLTMSGNEITDLTRLLATQGDGLAVQSMTGIWGGTTNLITNDGAETNTTGFLASGSTIARTTAQKKFGVASLSTVTDNAATREGWDFVFAGVDSTQYTFSVWMTGLNGGESVQLEFFDNGTGGSQISPAKVLVQAWARYTFTVSLGTGVTSASVGVRTTSQQAATWYSDGVQVETGAYASPLKPTDGGTASRTAARVRLPVHPGRPDAMFTPAQGWAAFRLRAGHASASAGNQRLLNWPESAGNFLTALHSGSGGNWTLQRQQGSTGTALTVADTFVEADDITVVFRWSQAGLGISVDGAVFTTSADINIPAITAEQADIGSNAGAEHWDGDIRWAVFGRGTLTDADAAALHAYGNNEPDFAELARDLAEGGDDAIVTGLWWGDTAAFMRPGEPRGASIVRAFRFSDPARWLQIPPGTVQFALEETGVVGLQVQSRYFDRWE